MDRYHDKFTRRIVRLNERVLRLEQQVALILTIQNTVLNSSENE